MGSRSDPAATDDIIAIPPEVTLSSIHRSQEMKLRGERSYGGNTYPLVLQPFGAEYWVVKSDASVWSPGQDLIVRVTPEDVHRAIRYYQDVCQIPTSTYYDARLVASVVAYAPPSGSVADARLWEHPEWAARAFPPKGVDVDSLAGPLEFVVPSFGDSFKAAVVVLSLADGPSQSYSASALKSYVEALHYRLDVGLRTSPFQQPSPMSVSASPSESESSPTWSPAGNELVYQADSAGVSLIRRRGLTGGNARRVTTGRQPDWSPRGDLIAFVRDSSANKSDVWLYDTLTALAQRLTFKPRRSVSPALSPNGRQIAYGLAADDTAGGGLSEQGVICVACGWEIRRVNVDGTNDTALTFLGGEFEPRSIRWSPDGQSLFCKKADQTPMGLPGEDQLWVVPAGGGTPLTRSDLAGDAVSFDLHRGSGPLLLAQAGTVMVPSLCYGVNGPETTFVEDGFVRLALRDTLSGDTQSRFYQTGASFYDVRWAPDGTRAAYSSNQNSVNVSSDRDLFVGQVSYNHAPSFVGLSDQGAEVGQAFRLEVTATDPDGESLTYDAPAAFLPPGASFDPDARRLTWPDPAPVGAEYFVLFRALDPSGGVDNRVVRFRVLTGGGGGCPFADTRTAAGWREENSVLGRSLVGSLMLDPYRLKFTPEVRDGRVRLRLRENEQEYTTLDQVRLVAVNHAPDVSAYAVGDRMFLGTRVPAYLVSTRDGRDITPLVSGIGGDYWGSPGDTLLVQMTASRAGGTFGATGTEEGGGGEGILGGFPKEEQLVYADFRSRPALPMNANAVDASVLASSGILIEVPDGMGGWRALTHYYPRQYPDETVVDSLGSGSCRLIFLGRHHLQFIGRYVRAASPAAPETLALLAARHSRLMDAKGAVTGSGGTATVLIPGDTLTLEFASTAAPAGQLRDYFLLSTGVYTSTAPLAQGHGSSSEAAPRPTRFALAQNRPNPFSGTTAIHFELPVDTRVRLDIFDAQGRLIRTLAAGGYPAGFHTLEWDHRTDGGKTLGAGVYLYRIQAGRFRDQKKMVLLAR
jgi:flagellar hook capping protein FlgD/putative Ig domain-containing protein/WD40 repeat protein